MKTESTGQEIYMQYNLPQPITGKSFLLGVCSVVVILALLQAAVNYAITLTGLGLLNLLFYILAVVVVAYFMSKTVFSTQAQLTDRTLTFSRRLGDSTTSVIVIPNEAVTGIYPVRRGECLNIYYKQTTYIDNSSKPTLRIRAGWLLSVLSARLGARVAGERIWDENGWAVSFTEDGRPKVCVFVPDEEMCAALRDRFTEAIFCADDRPDGITGFRPYALRRAFPELYPKVSELITDEELEESNRFREECEADKARKKRLSEQKRADGLKAKAEEKATAAKAVSDEKPPVPEKKRPDKKAKSWLQRKKEEREAKAKAVARVKARHAQLKSQKGKKNP